MNTLQRIFVACFCGATIGALLAIQFNHYFWWIGILFGGLVGYLSYEFMKVVRAVKTAWNEVCKEYESNFRRLRSVGSTVLSVFVEAIQVAYFTLLFLLVGLSWAIVVPLLVCPSFYFENSRGYIIACTIALSLLFGSFVSATYLSFAMRYRGITTPVIDVMGKYIRFLFIDANALSVLFRWVPKGICLIAAEIPGALGFLREIVKRTFILVHSEIRLLCMVDAMLGALTGYFCGNVLIGGVVGAILGVLNYKIISVRWLKLVRE